MRDHDQLAIVVPVKDITQHVPVALRLTSSSDKLDVKLG